LRKRLDDIDEDRAAYAGKPEWEVYLDRQRDNLEAVIRASGFTEEEVRRTDKWKTLGIYLISGKKGDATPHQKFLKTFTHMHWRQYSALAHAGYDGYLGEIPSGAYFVLDSLPHERRAPIEKAYIAVLTKHIGRAAVALLCIVTEVQLYFRFDGADINNRICQMWASLLPFFEATEIYEERYKQLLRERGIRQNA
jgi:hypothetical protein